MFEFTVIFAIIVYFTCQWINHLLPYLQTNYPYKLPVSFIFRDAHITQTLFVDLEHFFQFVIYDILKKTTPLT